MLSPQVGKRNPFTLMRYPAKRRVPPLPLKRGSGVSPFLDIPTESQSPICGGIALIYVVASIFGHDCVPTRGYDAPVTARPVSAEGVSYFTIAVAKRCVPKCYVPALLNHVGGP